MEPTKPEGVALTADAIIAAISQKVPWLADPVSEALRAASDPRKIGRLEETLRAVAADLTGFSSEISELYVNTADFKQILTQALRQAGDEPNDQKRRLYQAFLTDTITSPLEPYDKQMRFLHILKELRTDQILLLRTLTTLPAPQSHHAQSPLRRLQKELPDMPRDRMNGLLSQLTELDIATITDWSSTIAGNTEYLRNNLTPAGQRLMRFIRRSAQG